MNEEEIKELLKELETSKTGISWTIKGDEAYKSVEIIVRRHLNEAKALKEIAILKAKVYAYEQIIKNSSFRPLIDRKPTGYAKKLNNER
jgi:hypothetical protein